MGALPGQSPVVFLTSHVTYCEIQQRKQTTEVAKAEASRCEDWFSEVKCMLIHDYQSQSYVEIDVVFELQRFSTFS